MQTVSHNYNEILPVAASVPAEYIALNAASRAYNERRDCAVIAIAVVTDTPYPKVHELCKKHGRRNRCGTHWHIIDKVLADLGYRTVEVSLSYGARSVRALGPQLPADGKFLINVHRHVCAVRNSKVEDWSIDRGLQPKNIYRVFASHESDPALVIPQVAPKGRWKGGVSVIQLIRAYVEREFNETLARERATVAPNSKRWWLALRARAYAKLLPHGVNKTTAAIQMGKWQAEQGYDMKLLAK